MSIDKSQTDEKILLNINIKQFKFEILETVKYNDKEELFDIENNYIIQYDAINNGFNSRRNYKTEQVDI